MQPCPALRLLGVGELYCRWAESQASLDENRIAVDNDIAEATKEYRQTIAEARDYAKEHGARFFHVTQAILMSRTPTPWEQPIVDNYKLMPPLQAAIMQYA